MIVRGIEEINILRECGQRLARILAEVKKTAIAGVSTKELDDLGEKLIRENGGAPVFKGYRALSSDKPYPGSICVSINDEVVHGIPSPRRFLKDGDIVGLDIGMRHPGKGGLITDMAVTVGIGKISQVARFLKETTEEALNKGIVAIHPGIRLGDVSAVIQTHIEKRGFGVIRDLAGHGVGRELHEEPYVPNYGKRGTGPVLLEGMVLAIEPMATEKDWHVVLDKDRWTFRTKDGGLAAHFEHTIIITKDGAEVLTKI